MHANTCQYVQIRTNTDEYTAKLRNSLSNAPCPLGRARGRGRYILLARAINNKPFQCSNGRNSPQWRRSGARVEQGDSLKFCAHSRSLISAHLWYKKDLDHQRSSNFLARFVARFFPRYFPFAKHFQPCSPIAYWHFVADLPTFQSPSSRPWEHRSAYGWLAPRILGAEHVQRLQPAR